MDTGIYIQQNMSVPFCVDPPMTFHRYHESPWLTCAPDVPLLSCAADQHYYKGLYNIPSQPAKGENDEGYYGPSYIRKRNERERQRVKCVNEGYSKLRRHLPQEYLEKRLSKVQTLRAAIRYITHLQDILRCDVTGDSRTIIQEQGEERGQNSYLKYGFHELLKKSLKQ